MMSLTKCLLYICFFLIHSTYGKAQVVLPWRDDSLYTILKNKPMVIDLNCMSLEDALKKYPDLITTGDIDVTKGLGVGETILYTVFPQYKPVPGKKLEYLKPEFVNETTWSIDKTFDITVWYKKDSSGTRPILDRISYKGTMF